MKAMSQNRTTTFNRQDFFQNPYPFYDQLRSNQPIYFTSLLKQPGWYVTGYEEAVSILTDRRFKNRIPLPETSEKYTQLKEMQTNMLLFKNEADHHRLRSLVGHAFTLKMINQLRPYIQETANELLQSLESKKTIDVVTEFAFPLTSIIIAKILGIPEKDRGYFREWATNLIQTIDFTRSRRSLLSGNELICSLKEYFTHHVEKQRQQLNDDFISLLLEEEQLGDKLSREELLSTIILLVIAGHETTVNLISNSIFLLLKHPQQLKALKEKPSLIVSAVEEFLRYESPTQMTARVASEDVHMNNITIKKGDQIYILLGAANRDPVQFSFPNTLDITRNPNPHLAFGSGVHFCLGASLARVEAQIAIQSLLAWKDHMQLVHPHVKWRKLIGFRSLNELLIEFR